MERDLSQRDAIGGKHGSGVAQKGRVLWKRGGVSIEGLGLRFLGAQVSAKARGREQSGRREAAAVSFLVRFCREPPQQIMYFSWGPYKVSTTHKRTPSNSN